MGEERGGWRWRIGAEAEGGGINKDTGRCVFVYIIVGRL
jgi:hypothetical protein